jgi:hypothetical protein
MKAARARHIPKEFKPPARCTWLLDDSHRSLTQHHFHLERTLILTADWISEEIENALEGKVLCYLSPAMRRWPQPQIIGFHWGAI